MAERGFAGTSISEVSKRSGLPASSIYWHFESKEGLLGAVVEEGAQRWFDELEAEAGPRERDGGVLGSRAAVALERRPEFLRLMFLIALERKEIDKVSLAAIRHARKLALDRIRATVLRRLEAAAGPGRAGARGRALAPRAVRGRRDLHPGPHRPARHRRGAHVRAVRARLRRAGPRARRRGFPPAPGRASTRSGRRRRAARCRAVARPPSRGFPSSRRQTEAPTGSSAK